MKQQLNKLFALATKPVPFGALLKVLLYPIAVVIGRTDCKLCACRAAAMDIVLPNVNPISLFVKLVDAWKNCPIPTDDSSQ